MSTITDYMGKEHERCDQLFAEAEEVIEECHWENARQLVIRLQTEFERHFRAEEQILFPAIEARAGGAMGPTAVMRHEHEQIREGLVEIAGSVARDDRADSLAGSETLLIMIQQHNVKEEQILYPMADQLLGAEATALLERLRSS